MSNRAGIYLRLSDDREGRELGITRQEEDCRLFAEQNGYIVKMVFSENDTGASTRSKKPRPEYDAMLEAIRSGQIDTVIAYSNSRLTRRPEEYEQLIKLHDATGVRYRTVVSGEDNLATADGRMIARIKASIDAGEAERTGERAARAAEQRAKQGRSNGGMRPFGWSAADRTKLDPAEHAVIVEVATRILAGETLHSVAEDFNARKIGTVMGAKWSTTALRGMLINPRLAGHRMHNGIRVAEGNWEPAVDELTYKRLVRVLTDPDRKVSPGPARKSLLTSLARCEECGGPMSSESTNQRKVAGVYFYHCKPCGMWRSRGPVDLFVTAYMKRLLRQYKPAPDPGFDAKAQREAVEIQEQIDATIERFAGSAAMTPAQLETTLSLLNRRLADADARSVPPAPNRVLDGLTGPNPVIEWDDLPLDRQRSVINTLVTVTLLRTGKGSNRFDPTTVVIDRR